MTDQSDLSGVDEVVGEADSKRSKKENKSLISSAKKEKKKSKEKETRYAHLGDESSGEDEADGKSPLKIKKPKPFIFGSAKKDKEKKKEKEANLKQTSVLEFEAASGSSEAASNSKESHSIISISEKKKDKKEKHKLKLVKKSKQADKDTEVENKGEELCIFGVPLEVAVERQRCHDGVPLPMVVRLCIDYVEENGLMLEGIYRSSGVKSKVNKLRVAFNSRTCSGVNLNDYEPAVVASVLKLYVRELPDPVLTDALMPQFEKVSSSSNPQKRIEGMKNLIGLLPESNRALLTWIFVHMSHVIERERFNKMTLQNVSIVLSPTMRISHRVLTCFFENSHILFGDSGQFKKYVPPITSSSVNLPETEIGIEEEIRKQESLLADLHLQISSGAASKKTEEQIWEQQRIVTQLKRKLRTAIKKGAESDGEKKVGNYEPIDYEEDLDFSLRVPSRLGDADAISQISHDQVEPVEKYATAVQPVLAVAEEATAVTDVVDHKVTVTIQKPMTIEQDIGVQSQPPSISVSGVSATAQSISQQASLRESHVTVIKVQEETIKETKVLSESVVVTSSTQKPTTSKKAGIPLLPPPPASNKTRVPHSSILKPTPASPPPPSSCSTQAAPSTTTTTVKVTKPANNLTLQLKDSNEATAKSKSLPRGLPSDESAFNQFQGPPVPPSSLTTTSETTLEPKQPQVETPSPNELNNDADIEELRMECLRLKLEYDELMAVKSELEQRKRSEFKEMEDLREEIATMQTLYQYRTYSVDSSESSSDEGNEDKDVREEVEELTKVLSDLVRENRELEDKRLQLCNKIQEERSACINLRVQIRLEQDRIQRKTTSHQIRAN